MKVAKDTMSRRLPFNAPSILIEDLERLRPEIFSSLDENGKLPIRYDM